MKTTLITVLVTLFVAFGFTACDAADPLSESADESDALTLAFVSETLDAFPQDSLSEAEAHGLILMREEEKLARDVYAHLYNTWNMRIFSNIASSEATHMGAIGLLLERYDLEDPVAEDVPGSFENETLQSLYTALCSQGDSSLTQALTVGATIEDLDIMDLMELSEEVDNEDILFTYDALTKGSRNHIRSFTSQLTRLGQGYDAQFIEQSLLDSILATPKEVGNW